MSDDEVVLVERRGAVQVITINRAAGEERARTRPSAERVAAAVDELDASDDLRAGVLTGAGGFFSAGMDLKAFLRGETPAIEGRGLCGITQTPPRKPLVAAVEGGALAGGFELVLACDLVVAGRTARFGVPEVKRSLVAAGGRRPAAAAAGAAGGRPGAAAHRRPDRRRAGRRRGPGQPRRRRRRGAGRGRRAGRPRSPPTARWPWPPPSRSCSRRPGLVAGRGVGAGRRRSSGPVFASEDAREGVDRLRRDAAPRSGGAADPAARRPA